MITAIIPVRLSPEPLYDEIERIERILSTIPDDLFDVLIVDYGTCEARRHELQNIARGFEHCSLYRHECGDGPFSIGHARDLGVQHAQHPVTMFHDLDFFCFEETYRKIAQQVALRGLATRGYDFFCVPTIFLTAVGTEKYFESAEEIGPSLTDLKFHDYAQNGRRQYCQHFALGSSATVMNRYYYLSTGGHDLSFTGHGAEDFEFYHRVAKAAPKSARPKNYMKNVPDFFGHYEGFRAFFALYGQDIWNQGISMVHFHHPRRETVDKSYAKSKDNFELLKRRMMQHERGEFTPTPLADPRAGDRRTLALLDPTSSVFQGLRQAMPALGEVISIDGAEFETPDDMLAYYEEHKCDRILFLNPYGNAKRQAQYDAVRAKGVPYLTFDRGALPDSWFLDPGGFLGESDSYSPAVWNTPLDKTEDATISTWLEEFVESDNTLENNGQRDGVEYWRHVMGVGERKVIFVALQRPHDTATIHFSGAVGSTTVFGEWIEKMAQQLDGTKYVVVVKKHPLEDERLRLAGVTYAPDDAHIHDLIELAEKVVVINSGVGVLSLAFGKDVLCCGDAFYAHDGLAREVRHPDELVLRVQDDFKPDGEAVKRFLHHLVFKFYSFGKSRYREVMVSDGDRRKILTGLDFETLRVDAFPEVQLGTVPNQVPIKSYFMASTGIGSRAPTQPDLNSQVRMNIVQRALCSVFTLITAPVQGEKSLKLLKAAPVEFFSKAKHPMNKYFGMFLFNVLGSGFKRQKG